MEAIRFEQKSINSESLVDRLDQTLNPIGMHKILQQNIFFRKYFLESLLIEIKDMIAPQIKEI